jgi:hypothetical protein
MSEWRKICEREFPGCGMSDGYNDCCSKCSEGLSDERDHLARFALLLAKEIAQEAWEEYGVESVDQEISELWEKAGE